MIPAQLPALSIDDFGKWLIGALGAIIGIKTVLSCIESVKKVWGPKKSDETYVTVAQLEAAVEACALKTDIAAMQTNLDKLDNYVHKGFHDLRDDLNPLAIDMARITVLQGIQKDQIAELSKQGDATHSLLLEVRQLLQEVRQVEERRN